MEVPVEVQNICSQYLEMVRNDPEHQLKPFHRLKIYTTFGSEDDLEFRQVIGRLQLNTARHVFFIWQGRVDIAKVYYELPEEFLVITEDILDDKVDINSRIAHFLEDKAYYLIGNLEYDDQSADVIEAGQAARYALSNLRTWPPYKYQPIDENTTDEELREFSGRDAASAAILAYATITEDNYPTGKLDPSKCLEFWEWWLTEAIPQVWELTPQIREQ